MYEIYSIGDGAYLTAVLNAVAMLSGSGDMQQLAGIGFLMGILLVMGQGILQAKFPPLQNVLFAWVLYMAMFGPTARVQVEDLYSGATRHVENVPLGVAFVGSAMSKVGYGVTVLFEQAFSTPAMTEYGFAAPLQILQDTRKGTWSSVCDLRHSALCIRGGERVSPRRSGLSCLWARGLRLRHGRDKRSENLVDRLGGLEYVGNVLIEYDHDPGLVRLPREPVGFGICVVEAILLLKFVARTHGMASGASVLHSRSARA